MDWMQIQDGLGAPVSADGIYQRFVELPNANAKARFMRDYRLLPYGERESFNLCDDTRELDAMRDVMDVCARLAAIAGGMGDGERKATTNDLELVPGFEQADGGAFLHINLENSYWYKRYLYDSLNYTFEIGDAVFAPIRPKTLIDDDCQRKAGIYGWRNPEIEQLKDDSGTFWYSPALSINILETLNEHDRKIYSPSVLSDITRRLAFRSFTPVQDLRFDDPIMTDECDSKADFWTDNELIIREPGEDLRDVAGGIAHSLLLMHTWSTWHNFSFWDGFSLSAPMGVCALWADFAQDVAKRLICICKTCGRPVVETHAPRGLPRVYCSDACRMKDKRREKKQAQERASAIM